MRLQWQMDRQTETVDVYFILKTVFFVSELLRLSPCISVGDIGNCKIIVKVHALIHSLGMFMLYVGVFVYRFIETTTWENICNFGENILYFGALCQAVFAYCTYLLGCRWTEREVTRLSDLIGEIWFSACEKYLQFLLAMQILFVMMTVTGALLDISQEKSVCPESHNASMFYYVTEIAGFILEHRFFCIYA
jgi:hypothetical protein